MTCAGDKIPPLKCFISQKIQILGCYTADISGFKPTPFIQKKPVILSSVSRIHVGCMLQGLISNRNDSEISFLFFSSTSVCC